MSWKTQLRTAISIQIQQAQKDGKEFAKAPLTFKIFAIHLLNRAHTKRCDILEKQILEIFEEQKTVTIDGKNYYLIPKE